MLQHRLDDQGGPQPPKPWKKDDKPKPTEPEPEPEPQVPVSNP